jgi:hypothetical protein
MTQPVKILLANRNKGLPTVRYSSKNKIRYLAVFTKEQSLLLFFFLGKTHRGDEVLKKNQLDREVKSIFFGVRRRRSF